jgi:hypothetical protein
MTIVGGCPTFLCGSRICLKKLSKGDRRGPHPHINQVLIVKTADQVPAEVVQIGIDNGGNPRPLFIVPKHLTMANDGDNLARLRIDDIAKEHVFLSPSSGGDVYNSELAALFRLLC